MTTQPKQTTRSEEVIRKHKGILWPPVTNFYQQPLVADHWLDAIRLGRRGAQVLDFFRWHPYRFRGARQIPRSRVPSRRRSTGCNTFPRFIRMNNRGARGEGGADHAGALQSSFFTSSGTEANEAAFCWRGWLPVVTTWWPSGTRIRRIVADQERDRTVALAQIRDHQRGHSRMPSIHTATAVRRLEVSRLRGRVRQGRRNT